MSSILLNPKNELIGAQDRMVSQGGADTWQPSALSAVECLEESLLCIEECLQSEAKKGRASNHLFDALSETVKFVFS